MPTLEGTIALIAGGSRYRSSDLSTARGRRGIILHYNHRQSAAEEVAATIGRNVKLDHANLASPAEIQAMVDGLGHLRLNFLINNAGLWKGTPLGTTETEVIDEILDTNLKGPFWVTQCALPLLPEGARIINISSVAGRTDIAGGRSLYAATKAGIDSLTRNWALELAPRKILVNAVAPGYVTTI